MCPESKDPFWAGMGKRFQGPQMNHPVELPDGTLVSAASKEFGPDGKWGVGNWASAVVRIPANNHIGSQPGGSPWTAFYLPSGSGIQGAFMVLTPDFKDLLLVVRQGMGGGTPAVSLD